MKTLGEFVQRLQVDPAQDILNAREVIAFLQPIVVPPGNCRAVDIAQVKDRAQPGDNRELDVARVLLFRLVPVVVAHRSRGRHHRERGVRARR